MVVGVVGDQLLLVEDCHQVCLGESISTALILSLLVSSQDQSVIEHPLNFTLSSLGKVTGLMNIYILCFV